RVELTLPETGVCGGAGLFDAPDVQQTDGGGCCAAPEPRLVQLGTPAAVGAAAEEAPAGGCCG
ncbi:flavoprotein, partial [Streptomyces sp. NPDC052309]